MVTGFDCSQCTTSDRTGFTGIGDTPSTGHSRLEINEIYALSFLRTSWNSFTRCASQKHERRLMRVTSPLISMSVGPGSNPQCVRTNLPEAFNENESANRAER
jgi:hypothetical protein